MKKNNSTSNPLTLVHGLSGRNFGLQIVDLYNNWKLLPSQISTEEEYLVDPLWTYTVSPKYTNAHIYQSISDFKSKLTALTLNEYGLDERRTHIEKGSGFMKYISSPDSYRRLYHSYLELKGLYRVPGVKQIYLTGSVPYFLSRRGGDLDLIIECKKGWVWGSRFLIKCILKLKKKDVHSIFGQNILNLSKSKTIHFLLSETILNKLIKFANELIYTSKQRKNTIDVGLFFENSKEVVEVYKNSSHNYFILNPFILSSNGKLIRYDFNLSDNNVIDKESLKKTIIEKCLFWINQIAYWFGADNDNSIYVIKQRTIIGFYPRNFKQIKKYSDSVRDNFQRL
jgi:hypothetical protein